MEVDGVGEQMRLLFIWGFDEEVVVDFGKISLIVNIKFEKEELESYRVVYIGVYVLFSKESCWCYRYCGYKYYYWRRKDKELDKEDGWEFFFYDILFQRVQFIFGIEDDDEEYIFYDFFMEMDELCYRDGEEYEWKEIVRWLKFEEDVEDGGD